MGRSSETLVSSTATMKPATAASWMRTVTSLSWAALTTSSILRAIANGREYRMPSTINDPVSLSEIAATLTGMGYPKP